MLFFVFFASPVSIYSILCLQIDPFLCKTTICIFDVLTISRTALLQGLSNLMMVDILMMKILNLTYFSEEH